MIAASSSENVKNETDYSKKRHVLGIMGDIQIWKTKMAASSRFEAASRNREP